MNVPTMYQIGQHLHNFCRTFERDLRKPQMGRLKEMIHGLLRGKRAVLSEIAKQNRKGRVVRKQVEQYSRMLKNMPVEQMMRRKCTGFRRKVITDTPVYIDRVDITKKYFKSMEYIGTTWNGSEGMPGKGYEIFDVSIVIDDVCVTVLRRMYSTNHEEYKGELDECEKVLQSLMSAWGEIRGTIFLDAGADNSEEINLLLKYEASFAIRMNSKRGERDRIFLNEDFEGQKMMDLWGKKAQGITVWQGTKREKQKLVPLQWRKVWWKYRKEYIPLFFVWCHRENDPHPTVFLTTRVIENEAQATKLYHQYFGRGEEEAVFKCHKDKLGMEKVQLQSFEKVKNLMLLYVLVDQLLSRIECEAKRKQSIRNILMVHFLRTEQREITKWSIVDWYHEYFTQLERSYILFRRRYPSPEAKNQLQLCSLAHEKW